MAVGVRLNLLAPVLGLTIGVIVLGPKERRRAVIATWLGAVVLAGGFWYIRNLLIVGNPLPWFGAGVLPVPRPPLMQHTELSVWHYLTDLRVWSHVFIPDLGRALGPAWPAIVAVALGGAVSCVALGPGGRIRVIGLLTLFSAFSYLVTPGSAAGAAGHPVGFVFNFRYCAPALTLGLSTAPLAAPLRGPVVRWITFGVLAVLLGITVVNDAPVPAPYMLGAVLMALGLLLVAAASAWISAQALRALSSLRMAMVLLAMCGLVAAAVVGGYRAQRHYLRGRYVSSTRLRSVDRLWQWVASVHHSRIAMGGTFVAEFQYPLWGADASNRRRIRGGPWSPRIVYADHHVPDVARGTQRRTLSLHRHVACGQSCHARAQLFAGVWVDTKRCRRPPPHPAAVPCLDSSFRSSAPAQPIELSMTAGD